MSTSKMPSVGAPNGDAAGRPLRRAGEPAKTPAAKPATLNIGVDADDNCDPYNRTGQFLVEQLRKVSE